MNGPPTSSPPSDTDERGGWWRERFSSARRAQLATTDASGRPHLVPITFAVIPAAHTRSQASDVIVSAIDHKPKRTTRLRRLANITANPAVCLLVDHYDDDWTQLWWVRADGLAEVLTEPSARSEPVRQLAAKYSQYAAHPPAGPVIRVEVTRWQGWSYA